LQKAAEYGEVIAGVLCDREMVRYNRFPTVSIEERIRMLEELPEVSKVVVQNDIMYDNILSELKPDYVVHGDNWQGGPESAIRANVAINLARYGGKLIEVPYTYNEEIKKIDDRMRDKLAMPEFRRGRLKKLLGMVPIVKTLEVHSGLTGLIAEKTVVEHDGGLDQFDAMWISSLCDSTAKGKPDIELVDMTSRFRTINDLMEVTTKPIIFDGDTGGKTEHFVYTVRSLERMGVSMIIIEDKTGLKKNSLFGTEVQQTQDSIENFSEKIRAGKRAQLSDEFMIIARIESLILEQGMEDALTRAFAFVEAGADAIMIHSRKKDPSEIQEFIEKFRAQDKTTPIVLVPTSFNSITEEEWKERGANIIIYANQLMRAQVPAMQKAAELILEHHRAQECDDILMPFKDIIRLIPAEE
jgi:phosphoenolpyruvate phosphomutase